MRSFSHRRGGAMRAGDAGQNSRPTRCNAREGAARRGKLNSVARVSDRISAPTTVPASGRANGQFHRKSTELSGRLPEHAMTKDVERQDAKTPRQKEEKK